MKFVTSNLRSHVVKNNAFFSLSKPYTQVPRSQQNLTLCVPCIVFNYANKTNKMHPFYIYLFYNIYIHSTCFEGSYLLSSSAVSVIYCIHSSVQSRANVSNCFGFLLVTSHHQKTKATGSDQSPPENQSSWTRLHGFVQSCEYSKQRKLLLMKDMIVRNM